MILLFCYKYRLSNLHIHHRLYRKSPGYIRRGILCISQPTNHPIVIICSPCMVPEPNEGQDRQTDRIYPLPGRIHPLLLAHTIVLDRFHRGPMESLPNIISSHSNDYTQSPLLGAYMHLTLDTSLIYFKICSNRSSSYQNIQNYSKIFFLNFLYFYSHLFECSIIFLPYL